MSNRVQQPAGLVPMSSAILSAVTVLCLLTAVSAGHGDFDLCFNALRVCDPDPCLNLDCPIGQTCRTCVCRPDCYNTTMA